MPDTATPTKPRFGQPGWIDHVKAAIRERHQLDDGTEVCVKALPAKVQTDPVDEYKFSATITADVLDRDDEVVLPRGVDTSDFIKAKALFWNHSYDSPIGFAGRLVREDNRIDAIGNTFMRRPDDWQGEFFPDFARAFVTQASRAGASPGVSIGFIPVESRNPTSKDREQYGEHIRQVYTRVKLLEFSIAPVQSNPASFVTAIGKSVDRGVLKALMPDVELPAPQSKRLLIVVPAMPAAKRPKPKRRKGKPLADRVAGIVMAELAREQGRVYV